MDDIKDRAKEIVSVCTNCGHGKLSHLKPTKRDEGRSNLKSIRVSESECRVCKEQGQSCKSFKSE